MILIILNIEKKNVKEIIMSEYIIMTDTSADIPEEILAKGHIQLIPMAFELNGEERVHSDPGNWDSKEFYGKLRDGGQGKTSQIPPMVYTEYFEKILKEGKDICFPSNFKKERR